MIYNVAGRPVQIEADYFVCKHDDKPDCFAKSESYKRIVQATRCKEGRCALLAKNADRKDGTCPFYKPVSQFIVEYYTHREDRKDG